MASQMKHPSLYLDWYDHVPKLKYDFRSSGVSDFKYDLALGEVDLSVSYLHGNPKAARLLAQRYHVQPENVFISSEGASGQNARIIRYLAEKHPRKNEAIVEYPTYEPLLRLAQEHFPTVKRLKRNDKLAYRLNADELREIASEKTGLLVLTNPHLPSGATSTASELKEITAVARECDFYVLCDEVYAEFSRNTTPTVFSVDRELGMVTTSFSKAYGLGGLRIGVALAEKEIVDELYLDAHNTIGGSSNIVEMVAVRLLTEGGEHLERHAQKWMRLKNETEEWLIEKSLEYFPNKIGVTYWVKLPIRDTYKWTSEHTIPRYSLAAVPGAFFHFKNDYTLTRSNMIRLGLGNINPDKPNLEEGLHALEKALSTYKRG